MKLITVIWTIFALLFLSLSIFHFHAAQQEMPFFIAKPTLGITSINGVPYAKSGFEKFIPDMNSFIEKQNKSTRNQNYLSAIGYILAFITSVLSALLSTDKYSGKMHKNYFIRWFKSKDNK